MQLFEKDTNINIDIETNLEYPLEKILFFDIETTGFAAKNTKLYLIGAAYYNPSKESFHIMQWLIDTPEDEAIILVEFFKLLSSFEVVAHYNGSGFDIPYIEAKCKAYNLPYDFSNIKSFDIYKEISAIKSIFKLPNIKQKSIESFLDIDRTDKYSGGDLISVFNEYLNTKDSSLKDILLLHNHDDLLGLVNILPILNYLCVFNGDFDLSKLDICYDNDNELKEAIIECHSYYNIPKRISFGNNTYYITWYKDKLKIKVPIYTGGLKYFYPNYKDYYYLPKEDYSIHKSVAFYVDKNFRTKANAANCYSKKTGRFIPQIHEIIKPYFKINYEDKTTYFELTDDIINNTAMLKNFVLDTITVLSKK